MHGRMFYGIIASAEFQQGMEFAAVFSKALRKNPAEYKNHFVARFGEEMWSEFLATDHAVHEHFSSAQLNKVYASLGMQYYQLISQNGSMGQGISMLGISFNTYYFNEPMTLHQFNERATVGQAHIDMFLETVSNFPATLQEEIRVMEPRVWALWLA